MPAMDGLNSHQKRLGNVNSQTQVMFHFCPASTERLAELGKSNPGWPLRFPFQIQITYTPAENPMQERMRVISTDLPVTDAAEQVFPETDLALMSAFAALSTANLARDGEFEAARHLGAAYRDLLSIAMQYQQGASAGAGGPTYDDAGQEPLYDQAAVTADEDIYSNYVNAMSQLDAELQAGNGGDQLVEQTYLLLDAIPQPAQSSRSDRSGAAGSVPNPMYQTMEPAIGAGAGDADYNLAGAGYVDVAPNAANDLAGALYMDVAPNAANDLAGALYMDVAPNAANGDDAGYTDYDLASADDNGGYGVIRTRGGSDISGSRHTTLQKTDSLYDTAASALGKALPAVGHDYAANQYNNGESLYASIGPSEEYDGPNEGFEIPADE